MGMRHGFSEAFGRDDTYRWRRERRLGNDCTRPARSEGLSPFMKSCDCSL